MIGSGIPPEAVDVYFGTAYGRLCQALEGGTCECFRFQSELGSVSHQFLKRAIPGAGGGLCDLITPYGYGGPLVQAETPGDREPLIRAFWSRYTEYCQDQRVVSEFVRFHPIEKNHLGFEDRFRTVSHKKTLATNLQDYGHPYTGEFAQKRRRTIRKCAEAGITVDLDPGGATLEDFLGIYTDTMTRKDAKEFYFFDRAYFEALLAALPGNVLIANARLAGRTIASGIYLYNDTYIHAHLSGTLTEFLPLSPASALRNAIADWGHSHGQRYFHHGGGVTDSLEDGLYQFKKSFCMHTDFDFHVGRKIWDQECYDRLAGAAGAPADTGFFPAYRSRT